MGNKNNLGKQKILRKKSDSHGPGSRFLFNPQSAKRRCRSLAHWHNSSTRWSSVYRESVKDARVWNRWER